MNDELRKLNSELIKANSEILSNYITGLKRTEVVSWFRQNNLYVRVCLIEFFSWKNGLQTPNPKDSICAIFFDGGFFYFIGLMILVLNFY